MGTIVTFKSGEFEDSSSKKPPEGFPVGQCQSPRVDWKCVRPVGPAGMMVRCPG